MDIVCGFRSIQEMAQAVRESAELMEGRRYSPRPWNRFEPENTDWWIVPSTDWPAYRYGKGMFKSRMRFPDRIFCGLNMEKGFGRVTLEVYPELRARKEVIEKNWTWFAFLEGLTDGTVAQAAEALAQETGSPTLLAIEAWYTSSPVDFDPYMELTIEALEAECRSPLDGGRVWFSIRDGVLEKLEQRCIQEVMLPVANCHHLRDLPSAFQDNAHMAWAWVNVYIGTLVSLPPDDQPSDDHWTAGNIWRKLMHPWLPWIV